MQVVCILVQPHCFCKVRWLSKCVNAVLFFVVVFLSAALTTEQSDHKCLRLSVYVCVSLHILHAHTHRFTCARAPPPPTPPHTHTRNHACTHTHAQPCMHMCACVCARTHTHTNTHKHTHRVFAKYTIIFGAPI